MAIMKGSPIEGLFALCAHEVQRRKDFAISTNLTQGCRSNFFLRMQKFLPMQRFFNFLKAIVLHAVTCMHLWCVHDIRTRSPLQKNSSYSHQSIHIFTNIIWFQLMTRDLLMILV